MLQDLGTFDLVLPAANLRLIKGHRATEPYLAKGYADSRLVTREVRSG